MSEEISLENIGGGAAVVKFNHELAKVIADILDPNSPAKATRKITVEVSIKPSADRSFGAVTISASSKIPPLSGISTVAFFGIEKGRAIATENDSKQTTIDDYVDAKPTRLRDATND